MLGHEYLWTSAVSKHSLFLTILLQALCFHLRVVEQLVLWAPSYGTGMSSGSWSQASVLQAFVHFSSYQQTLRKWIYIQWFLYSPNAWSFTIEALLSFWPIYLSVSFRDWSACWWSNSIFQKALNYFFFFPLVL